ncbi:hypothetical protein DPMN_159726 [Dreissena polymorpha]|uniref:Uncharacterized protein n=1 Tax=Dreissena polymorpha TaxID=45954 RepID=A0A9D4IQY7_DREPO|nr:hypothetical protein DPMN_159726 [Dreissena polymorpha]
MTINYKFEIILKFDANKPTKKQTNRQGKNNMIDSLPPVGYVFQPTGTIFQLLHDSIGTNLVTKFHEDWTINVATRYHIRKNAYPRLPYGIRTNLQAKFHEDWTINMASRVLTRENALSPFSHAFQAN